jgi:acetyltransferase-like isoleucine patch superfamily enzyme
MSHATISGNVRIGTGAFIGVGAATRQGIAIGEWALLGAGAVAVGDVPPLCVACGVPAKPVRAYASPEEMPPF